jgi:catechol 2,3-dioxygenase-like lactoylglutathione lyase family enzyme
MNIKGLVHININCSSFERSRKFYEKLGFEVFLDVPESNTPEVAAAVGFSDYQLQGGLMALKDALAYPAGSADDRGCHTLRAACLRPWEETSCDFRRHFRSFRPASRMRKPVGRRCGEPVGPEGLCVPGVGAAAARGSRRGRSSSVCAADTSAR